MLTSYDVPLCGPDWCTLLYLYVATGCIQRNSMYTCLQLPDLNVWYGPDTYMGKNLQELFTSLATMPDEEVAAVHPSHTAASIAQCVPRLHAYPEGMCVVHHIFGGETADAVRRGYADAYITAHFEVPGEMFGVAMEAQRQRGMGVVGSTSNILGFIAEKVQAAQQRGFEDKLQFVLGTETGMITSIVRKVQQILSEGPDVGLDVEIVFPVAPDAITTEQTSGSSSSGANTPAQVELPGGLAVVPGPAGGEGCSSEGGCAACPYMKMNSLAALERVCGMIGSDAAEAMLAAYKPKAHQDKVSTVISVPHTPVVVVNMCSSTVLSLLCLCFIAMVVSCSRLRTVRKCMVCRLVKAPWWSWDVSLFYT